MASGLVFGGTFEAHPTLGATFKPDDPQKFKAARVKLAGKRVEVVLRRPRSKRSLDLNAYWHAQTGPFRLLGEHFGYELEEIKLALLGEWSGWVEVMGRQLPRRPNTSDLTVEEGKEFTDWMIRFGAEHGVMIPLPNEVE